MPPSTYIVLKLESTSGQTWRVIANATAYSAEQAIREVCELTADKRGEPPNGVFVAVPERSWNPVTVRTEQKTLFRFGEAEEQPRTD